MFESHYVTRQSYPMVSYGITAQSGVAMP